MTGLGNDYVYLDLTEQNLDIDFSELSKIVSNRNFGIGSDGLVVMGKSTCADVKMRIFNADGSEAEICGNALRCIGKYFFDKKQKTKLSVETKKKIVRTEIVENFGNEAKVKVEMGKVKILSPFKADIFGKSVALHPVDVGNPHCIVFVNNFDFDISKYGQEISSLAYFNKGTNVEFVKIKQQDKLRVRVFERGSGVTMACGSGACASAMCYHAISNPDSQEISVELDGGVLDINCEDAQNVIMTGSATRVFDGTMDIGREKVLSK